MRTSNAIADLMDGEDPRKKKDYTVAPCPQPVVRAGLSRNLVFSSEYKTQPNVLRLLTYRTMDNKWLAYFSSKCLPDIIPPPQSQASTLHHSHLIAMLFLLPYSGRLHKGPPKLSTSYMAEGSPSI